MDIARYIPDIAGFVRTGISVFPLVAAHLLYPPLSTLQGYERVPSVLAGLYSLLPREILRSSFISQYMLLENTWHQEKFVAWISHLFIHGSYSHLINNICGIIAAATPIRQRLGTTAIYVAFFGGGICAALPSPIHSAQVLRSSREIVRSIDGLAQGSLLGWIARPILSGGAKLIQKISELTDLRCCGSSGAVYSLWALSTVLLIEESIFVQKDKGGAKYEKFAVITRNSLSILSFTTYVMAEVNDVFGTSDKGVFEAVFSQGQNIGHAAHLQGAIFGAIVGIGVVLFRKESRQDAKSN